MIPRDFARRQKPFGLANRHADQRLKFLFHQKSRIFAYRSPNHGECSTLVTPLIFIEDLGSYAATRVDRRTRDGYFASGSVQEIFESETLRS